ncbi:MAG: flippase [Candidatus Electrothrix sp. ATG2]|nr:flippase [Candidatus Electrothrix sp. ATG2]
MMPDKQINLTSGRSLACNVFWNLLGTGAPLLVALVAVPMLIKGLGAVRFGVLTLAWMMIGYFNLFDMGLGRALTKLVAEKLGKEQKEDIPSLIWTAMMLMVGLSIFSSVVLVLFSPWLVGSVLKIPPDIQGETLTAFYLLAASIPFVMSTTGLRGIIEAHQRFGLVNGVRIPLGIITFLGPVAVLPYSTSLVPVVAILVAARLCSCCAYMVLCLHVVPDLRCSFSIHRTMLRPLINFGGWATLTNLIGPLMVYMDRFLVGAMISMTAVVYYATPYDIVTKLWIIPGALMGVMFPAFSSVLVQDKERAALLYARVIKYIFLTLFPAALVIVTFARDGLNLWIGSEFADNSSLVLKLLAIGVFINSHAHAPSGLLQSAGRPDITAKLHLIELPCYLLMLWWLLGAYGIVGVAIAWLLRVAVDTLLLFVLAHKLLPAVTFFTLQSIVIAAIALSVLILAAIIPELALNWLFLLLTLSLYIIVFWIALPEKDMLCTYFKINHTKEY